jgi:hypothetical protein
MSEHKEQNIFLKESDAAYETVNRDQAEYDKQLLTLSAGFLAVSIAFIKDVVPLKEAEFLPLLYGGFGLLVCCIFLVLSSYQVSIAGNLKAKEYWDSLHTGHLDVKFPNGHVKLVRWLNLSSGIVFFSGVFLFVTFVILNLHHEASMPTFRTGDGSYIKTPSNDNGEDRGSHIKVPVQPSATKPSSSTNGGNAPTKKQ